MRVLIVDDHMLFADGLAGLLRLRGVDVIGTACDGTKLSLSFETKDLT